MLTAPVHPSGLMACDDGGEWHLPVQIITWLHQHGGCLWSLFNSHHQVSVNSCSSIGQWNAYKPAFVYFCCTCFPGGLTFMRPDVIAIWGSTLLAVLDVLNAASMSAPYPDLLFVQKLFCVLIFYPTVLAVLLSWKSRAEAASQGPSVGRFKVFICPGCISLFQSDYWIGTTKYKKVKMNSGIAMPV